MLDTFRANPRARCPAFLVRDDGSEYAVTITEFTKGGFRMVVSLRPELGERVLIRVSGCGDVRGQIRWAYGTEAGGSF